MIFIASLQHNRYLHGLPVFFSTKLLKYLRVTWLFNVMEWGILMAITEDMTLNTLQQRMIRQKTQTKTLVKIFYN